MQFDPNNTVVKLCAGGMDLEAAGQPEAAADLFLQAWEISTNDLERLTAAHYVARQKSAIDKLKWDEVALNLALKINDENVKGAYPSLYLNVAKGYEDLNDFNRALDNYNLALGYTGHLLDDGYGRMIKGGIVNGIDRVSAKKP